MLEIGCSAGKLATLYTQKTKKYYGCDISDEGIRVAKELGLENAEFVCCDAHKLPYNDNYFDYVIVNSLLHHLDLDIALSEIRRVLVPNGKLLFREPLGINPFFQIYRALTPGARTPDERPFNFSDLRTFRKYFHTDDIEFYGFLKVLYPFCPKIRLIEDFLDKLDAIFSRTYLRFWFWMISGSAEVKK